MSAAPKGKLLVTIQTWVAIIIAITLLAACVSNSTRKAAEAEYVPPSRIATSTEAQKVADACGDHMQIYARNKFQGFDWRMSFVGDVKVAPPSKRGEHRGYVVAVDVDLGGGSVAKMLCGVDADYAGQRFSYR